MKGGEMKRNFLLAFVLLLPFGAIITFTGCDNAMGYAAETAALDTARAAAVSDAAADLGVLTITGPLAVIDGPEDLHRSFAVLYQGNPWFIKGLSRLRAPAELAEGAIVTVAGKASPILGRDGEGNSLFWGYCLEAEVLSVEPEVLRQEVLGS
jgi:hypothetical protein